MERAIWFSRHTPVPKQVDVLKQKGIEIIAYIPGVRDAEEALYLIKSNNAKYVIPVLPLSIIVKLLELAKTNNFIILYAEMEKVHNIGPCPPNCPFDPLTDTIDKGRHFRFKQFKILKDIQFVFEDF